MSLSLMLPFTEVEKIPLWAYGENQIDFHHDTAGATRCTMAFAAMELKTHLEKTLESECINFHSGVRALGVDDTQIVLEVNGEGRPSGSFSLVPQQKGIRLVGEDRVGILYAVYAFLNLQGWRWIQPGEAGVITPGRREELSYPSKAIHESPAFPLCRGFHFAFRSQESADLLQWMARNRLNLAGYRHSTGALGRKLGFVYKDGGHIFENLLDPGRRLPDGRTFWEAHEQWYGLPASGQRSKAEALRTQFCVSQPDLLDFLAGELVKHLEGRWRHADMVLVWGFDTWGSSCTCPQCRKRGNASDHYMVLLSRLREAINEAVAAGRLHHPVRMVGCAYEGTCTLEGPEKEIPANLREGGDVIVYYPIDRSYFRALYDPESATNRPYAAALDSWMQRPDALPVIAGEYYNVSKYEDLPLLFSESMSRDIPSYYERGAAGMTYMHLPFLNWALRAQTQCLYARMTWNPEVDIDAFRRQYFSDRYGPWAEDLATICGDVERAFARIAEWRNWHQSFLAALLRWDGRKPEKPLAVANELGDAAAASANGREALSLLDRSLEQLARIRSAEKRRGAEDAVRKIQEAVNPAQIADAASAAPYELALGEDWRLLQYGREVMALMTATVEYHQALFDEDAVARETAWGEMETAAERLESGWIPISYEHPGAGLKGLDALTRSQLRELLQRCRNFRLENQWPL